jgi:hypothetical protein
VQTFHFVAEKAIRGAVDGAAETCHLQHRILGASKGFLVLDIFHPLAITREIRDDLSTPFAIGAADIKAYSTQLTHCGLAFSWSAGVFRFL